MSQPCGSDPFPAGETASTSIDLDQPASEVWRSIVEPERLARWMGEGSTIEPWTSGELRLTDIATGVPKRGRVASVVPGRSIEFVWWPDDDPGQAGQVSFTLTPLDAGTRFTVIETAPAATRPGRAFAMAGPAITSGRTAAGAIGYWRLALLAVAVTLAPAGAGW
jgi:uncharacterized protein YndB with AHSA1/START domain